MSLLTSGRVAAVGALLLLLGTSHDLAAAERELSTGLGHELTLEVDWPGQGRSSATEDLTVE